MNRDLTESRAIVTGASSGIGRAVAVALAEAGARVALVARSRAKLEALATQLPGGVAVPGDVAVAADRERIIRETIASFGGLDLLVNNAGIASWGHFATSTQEINRQILEVNFFGPAELTRLAVPHLMAGRSPVVVNVTSMCGRRGMPAWPEYSASKAALVGLSEALRGEFARFGIDVVTIVPGLTRTDLNSHLLRSEGRAKLPFEKGMEPAEVAAAVVKAVRGNRREVVLGTEAKRILRMNRFFPRLLNRMIAKRVTKLYVDDAERSDRG